MATPNFYSLTGSGITVNYSPAGTFEFSNGTETLNFSGSQITTESTDIGTLVTVAIRTTIDTGATLFSVLIPFINLPRIEMSLPFSTIGIETLVKGPDSFPRTGAGDFYVTVNLSGTASDFVHLVKQPLKHAAAQ